MNRAKILVVITVLLLFVTKGVGQEIPKLGIAELPNLPAQEQGKTSLGFAGMIGGFQNDAVIAAGGANFPGALPWEGGKKVYSDKIYVLNNGQWQFRWWGRCLVKPIQKPSAKQKCEAAKLFSPFSIRRSKMI